MKLSQYLSKAIASGHSVMLQDKEDECYRVFNQEINGKFYGLYSQNDKEEAKLQGPLDCAYTYNEIDEDFKNPEIVTKPPVLLEKGDKVQILDFCRKGGITQRDEMIGQSGLEIKEILDEDYKVLNKDKSDWWTFPHSAVAPSFESEPTEMTIKQIEEKLNITGLKIVK
jgi:hypothetical protein